MNNPYKVLGVNEGASQEEIRSAYLKLVKKYHPDKYTDSDLKELANEKLVEVNEAYEMLTKKNGQSSSYANRNGNGTYDLQRRIYRLRKLIFRPECSGIQQGEGLHQPE